MAKDGKKKEKKAKKNTGDEWQESTATEDGGKTNCSGRSILDMMWEELDAVFERLISENPAEDGRDPGRAEGIAMCIAIVQRPYNPSIDSVREQAMQRWREKNPEWEESAS